MAKTLVKTTQDGRKVEVIGLAICLEGELEAFELVEVKLAVDADAPCLDVACEVPGCHDGRSGA